MRAPRSDLARMAAPSILLFLARARLRLACGRVDLAVPDSAGLVDWCEAQHLNPRCEAKLVAAEVHARLGDRGRAERLIGDLLAQGLSNPRDRPAAVRLDPHRRPSRLGPTAELGVTTRREAMHAATAFEGRRGRRS